MSDARRKAEDALALFDLTLDPFGAAQCVIALRALLAETPRAPLAPPPAPPAFRCTLPSGGCYHREPAPAPSEARSPKGNCAGCNGRGFILVGDGHRGEVCACVGAPAPYEAVREAWMDSARQFARNEAYYRGLIETALKDVPDAYLCDDGTRSEDVLCAKLPDIVAALLAPSPPAGEAVREAWARIGTQLLGIAKLYADECDARRASRASEQDAMEVSTAALRTIATMQLRSHTARDNEMQDIAAEALRTIESLPAPSPPSGDAVREAAERAAAEWMEAQDVRLNVPLALAIAMHRLAGALAAPRREGEDRV